MDAATGFPAQDLGSCVPNTPFGEANKYTCQPAIYSGTYTNSLTPGVYYWWTTFLRQDPGELFPTIHISGPFEFTVVQPTAPTGVNLVSPANAATVSTTPRLTANMPASAQIDFYVSTDADTNSDGSPLVGAEASCSGTTTNAGLYYCDVAAGSLISGETYYWWVIVEVGGSSWKYGPQTFIVNTDETGGSGGSGGSGAGSGSGAAPPQNAAPPTRSEWDAPKLHPSTHYTGQSVRQTRLGDAAYQLSKALGVPKTVDVACWSVDDWASVSGGISEPGYTTLGFWSPVMPHWLQLSPRICRGMETLIYHRPKYTNRITADALDTLTHEMLHPLGIKNEAQTECLAMQLNYVTGIALGLPLQYAENLDRLSLANYGEHPARYIDRSRCREGGAWDIFPTKPSLPWHLPSV